jgi:hypothetical protein
MWESQVMGFKVLTPHHGQPVTLTIGSLDPDHCDAPSDWLRHVCVFIYQVGISNFIHTLRSLDLVTSGLKPFVSDRVFWISLVYRGASDLLVYFLLDG